MYNRPLSRRVANCAEMSDETGYRGNTWVEWYYSDGMGPFVGVNQIGGLPSI